MFAGIDTARDWPPSGMTTHRWLREVPVRRVELGDLVATQEGVHLAPLLEQEPGSYCGDPYPHVIAHHGRLLLEDGHHRAIRALLNGATTLDARVLVLDPRRAP